MQKGDIVLLKSGSPLMTVKAVVNGTCLCVYWNPYLHQFSELKTEEELLIDANSHHTPVYYSNEINADDRFNRRNS